MIRPASDWASQSSHSSGNLDSGLTVYRLQKLPSFKYFALVDFFSSVFTPQHFYKINFQKSYCSQNICKLVSIFSVNNHSRDISLKESL